MSCSDILSATSQLSAIINLIVNSTAVPIFTPFYAGNGGQNYISLFIADDHTLSGTSLWLFTPDFFPVEVLGSAHNGIQISS
jgi:hypothetical protein